MFSNSSASTALIISLALASAGCASTSLNSEWNPDAQPQQFERITTALMVSDVGLRRAFEERVSAKAGERFVPSLDLLFPGKTYEEGEVLSILEENGVDGVLLVNVQDAGADEAYIPGSSTTSCSLWSSSQGCMQATTRSTPGGTISRPWASFTVSLWDLETLEAVWYASAESGGNAFANTEDLLNSLADETLKELREGGVVR